MNNKDELIDNLKQEVKKLTSHVKRLNKENNKLLTECEMHKQAMGDAVVEMAILEMELKTIKTMKKYPSRSESEIKKIKTTGLKVFLIMYYMVFWFGILCPYFVSAKSHILTILGIILFLFGFLPLVKPFKELIAGISRNSG